MKNNIEQEVIHHKRLYSIWRGMLRRCYSEHYKSYHNYGGRGIIVCDSWIDNITEFKEWALNNGYQVGLTLDRIDTDGNYEPNNCRWVTRLVQNRNTRVLRSTNKSGYRGVHWSKKDSRWCCQIKVNRISLHLGSFKTPLEASYAYDLFVYYHNLEHTTNHPKESYTEEQLSQPQKPLPISKNKSQE